MSKKSVMQECIPAIRKQIEKRFNPTGNNFFELVQMGDFSGKILSENIVLMTNKAENVLHVTHPKLLEDYREPLIKVKATRNTLEMEMTDEAYNFPEIVDVYQEEIMWDDGD